MKMTEGNIYRCYHCNKPSIYKGAMTTHERMCKKNPNNQHKCFQYCKYLTKDRKIIYDEYGNVESNYSHFLCEKLNLNLYSYKLERNYVTRKMIDNLIRMPLQCDSYEIENGHEYFNSFPQ